MPSDTRSAERKRRPACLPPHWRWFGIIAVLPFALAALTLEFVVPAKLPLEQFRGAFDDSTAAGIGQLGDRLNYAALAFIQFASALLVIGFYVHRLCRLDPARRAGAWRLLAFTAVPAAATILLIRGLHGVAYTVSYPYVRDLLRLAEFTHDFTVPFLEFTMPVLGDVGVTRLSVIVGVPFLLGAIAVILAVPTGAAAASFAQEETQDWDAGFAERIQWLQQAFYAASIMLVTSTLAVMVFFQLPAEIAAETLRADMLRFAHGLTVFWGATMTLTLVATFAPAMIALRQHARQRHGKLASDVEFDEWFSTQVPTSARRQIANLTTLLAPLLVGPLGNIVQSAFAAG